MADVDLIGFFKAIVVWHLKHFMKVHEFAKRERGVGEWFGVAPKHEGILGN